MEQNMEEAAKAQELKDLIWFGQGQILGEIINSDPVKAETDPTQTRKTALNLAFMLKDFIDKQVEERKDETGANEVYISAVQIMGRKLNADYQQAINNPTKLIEYAFNTAILSIAEIDAAFKKRESELTEA